MSLPHEDSLGDLAHAFGPPAARGRIKTAPEDFRVSEQLGFEPEGSGAHLWLRVRKRGANTEWVARRLARAAGVAVKEVGFAGLKDRQSIAEQWFSMPLARDSDVPDFGECGEGIAVIQSIRHSRKLKRGGLKSNGFEIAVRDLQGDRDLLEEKLSTLQAAGVPNYFGPQRFGIDAGNLQLAYATLVRGERMRDRSRRAFAYSAARSLLFNLVVSHRVTQGSWNQLVPGEVANLDGVRSTFAVAEIDPTLTARLRQLDIHPTGPLWGIGESPVQGEVYELEQQICGKHPLARGLEQSKLRAARRSLRLPVRALDWTFSGTTMTLSFRLAAGGYATSVIRELLDVS